MTKPKRARVWYRWMRRCGRDIWRLYGSEANARVDVCAACRIARVEIREVRRKPKARKKR